MTRRSRGRLGAWARGVVVDWTLRYTRSLPGRTGRDRSDEVVSDLWEHGAASDARGASGASFAVEVLARTLRGVPADLAWRRAQLAAAPAPDGRATSLLARKRWGPLTGEPLFDQTNGVVALGPADEPDRDGDVEADLLARGIAANAVNVGFLGGSF